MNERLIKILEGYEMHCASGEYEFIHRKFRETMKDGQAVAVHLVHETDEVAEE